MTKPWPPNALGRREREHVAPIVAIEDDDGLDEASNVVIDLIRAGRLDEAEQAAQDRLERLAMVARPAALRPSQSITITRVMTTMLVGVTLRDR